MWDLIVSVPDHGLSFYFPEINMTFPSHSLSTVPIKSCVQ